MKHKRSALMLALAATGLVFSSATLAQDVEKVDEEEELTLEEVIVTGSARQALASAINTKRNADNLVEAIYAEDIGKLPDQTLAEVLENVTGVQITRRAGVGTGVG